MISKKVRALREARGWTQQELSRLVGVGQSQISGIELGVKMPSMRVLIRLAEVFNVSTDDLFSK